MAYGDADNENLLPALPPEAFAPKVLPDDANPAVQRLKLRQSIAPAQPDPAAAAPVEMAPDPFADLPDAPAAATPLAPAADGSVKNPFDDLPDAVKPPAAKSTGGSLLDRVIGDAGKLSKEEGEAAGVARRTQAEKDLWTAQETLDNLSKDPKNSETVDLTDEFGNVYGKSRSKVDYAKEALDAARKENDAVLKGPKVETQNRARNVAEGALEGIIGVPEGIAKGTAIGLEGLGTIFSGNATKAAEKLAGAPAPGAQGPAQPLTREELVAINNPGAADTIAAGAKEVRQKIHDWFEPIAVTDPAKARDFSSKLAQGAGSTVGFMGAGFLGKALGMSGTAVTAISGALPVASSMFEDAEKAGADPVAKWTAFIAGLPIGATEAIPFAGLNARIASQNRGKFLAALDNAMGGRLMEALRHGSGQAAEEAAQEMLQTGLENLVAKGLYDPDRALGEGILEGGAVGGITGGAMGGALGFGRRARPRRNDETDAAVDPTAAPPAPGAPAPVPAAVDPAAPPAGPAPAAPGAPVVDPAAVATPAQPEQPRAVDPVARENAILAAAGHDPDVVADLNKRQRARLVSEALKGNPDLANVEVPGAAVEEAPEPALPAPDALNPVAPEATDATPAAIEEAAPAATEEVAPGEVAGPGAPVSPQLEVTPATDSVPTRAERFNDMAERIRATLPTEASEGYDPARVESLPQDEFAGITAEMERIFADREAKANAAPITDADRAEIATVIAAERMRKQGIKATPLTPADVLEITKAAEKARLDTAAKADYDARYEAARSSPEGQTAIAQAQMDRQLANRRGEDFGEPAAPVPDASRRAPIDVQTPEDLDRAGERVADPTPAQAEAGNYRQAHVKVQGLDVAIETPKGGVRRGVGSDGKAWEVQMPAGYGRIKGTTGADGEQIDAYVGSNPASPKVWVVNQKDAVTGKFDEHKAFVGFDTAAEVRQAYVKAFSDGKGASRFGGMSEMTTDQFKAWTQEKQTAPVPTGRFAGASATPQVNARFPLRDGAKPVTAASALDSALDEAFGPEVAEEAAPAPAPAATPPAAAPEAAPRAPNAKRQGMTIRNLTGRINKAVRVLSDGGEVDEAERAKINTAIREGRREFGNVAELEDAAASWEDFAGASDENLTEDSYSFESLSADSGVRQEDLDTLPEVVTKAAAMVDEGVEPAAAVEAAILQEIAAEPELKAAVTAAEGNVFIPHFLQPKATQEAPRAVEKVAEPVVEAKPEPKAPSRPRFEATATPQVNTEIAHPEGRSEKEQVAGLKEIVESEIARVERLAPGGMAAVSTVPQKVEAAINALKKRFGSRHAAAGEALLDRYLDAIGKAEAADAAGTAVEVVPKVEPEPKSDTRSQEAEEREIRLYWDTPIDMDLVRRAESRPSSRNRSEREERELDRLRDHSERLTNERHGARIAELNDEILEATQAKKDADTALFDAQFAKRGAKYLLNQQELKRYETDPAFRTEVANRARDEMNAAAAATRRLNSLIDERFGFRARTTAELRGEPVEKRYAEKVTKPRPAPKKDRKAKATPEAVEQVTEVAEDFGIRSDDLQAIPEVVSAAADMVERNEEPVAALDQAIIAEIAADPVLAQAVEEATGPLPTVAEMSPSPTDSPGIPVPYSGTRIQAINRKPRSQRSPEELAHSDRWDAWLRDRSEAIGGPALRELDREARRATKAFEEAKAAYLSAGEGNESALKQAMAKAERAMKEAQRPFEEESSEVRSDAVGEFLAAEKAAMDGRSWSVSGGIGSQEAARDSQGAEGQGAQRAPVQAQEIQGVGERADGPVGGRAEEASEGRGEVAPRRLTVEQRVQARFAQMLRGRHTFDGISEARAIAREMGFTYQKGIDEAMEAAVVEVAREIVAHPNGTPRNKFAALVNLYKRQPRLSARTSDSVAMQAYSTPVPLAYLASHRAGINADTMVLEPTAGNGALLVGATPSMAHANELDPARAEVLRATGFNVTERDATDGFMDDGEFDAVLANPPFGAVTDATNKTRRFDMADQQVGYSTNEVDHVIALRALEQLKQGGKATLILGAPSNVGVTAESDRTQGYAKSKAKREFYLTLYGRYNVTDHFVVDGGLYDRQGAGWPVDVITIDGRGQSARQVPMATAPDYLTTWDQVKERLDGPVDVRGQDGGVAGVVAAPAADTGGEVRGADPLGDGGMVRDSGPVVGGDVRVEPDQVQSGDGQPAKGRGRGKRASGGQPVGTGEQGGVASPAEVTAASALDGALDEAFGPAPVVAPAAAAPAKPKGVKPVKNADERSSKDVAVSLAVNAKDALANAASGLEALFGMKNVGSKLNSGIPLDFNQETYEQSKPLFQAAFANIQAASRDMNVLAKRLVEYFRTERGWQREHFTGIRPYMERFIQDVNEGHVVIGEPVGGREVAEAAPAAPKAPRAPRAAPTPSQGQSGTTAQETTAAPQAAVAPAPAPARVVTSRETEETEGQVTYTPGSKGSPGLGTLTPANMRASTNDAIENLVARVGAIDDYVGRRLGYDAGEMAERFGGEQVDALALAIDNIERGKGFIIGDQTGIGKGRVNAGVIRYALRNDLIPIFVTEKPNLYADMWRDMNDIGMEDFLGRAPKILATNGGLKLDLDERGNKIANASGKGHDDRLKRLAEGAEELGLAGEADMIFTTYSQMQTVKGESTSRQAFLEAMAPRSVLILDESHNAGGSGSKSEKEAAGPPNRAQFVRNLVRSSKSVFYSSATYAKRPDVMTLYSKTDMRLAVTDEDALATAIEEGGVPMQQAVAAMLAKAGQYVRRERSFAGVRYETPTIEVNRELYNDFSGALQAVQEFSLSMEKVAAAMKRELQVEGKQMSSGKGTGGAAAESTQFTSVMHNVINQMLLGLKARQTADLAIESIKAGEKPVIALSSTMESFLDEYASDRVLKKGDAVDLNFTDIIKRYLELSRTVTVKRPFGDSTERVYMTDEQLSEDALEKYQAAVEVIEALDMSEIPASPIDYIRHRIEAAGYRTGEITGRGMTLDYSGARPTLSSRPSTDRTPSGRTTTIRAFNGGSITNPLERGQWIDAIILNQSGATGLSLHANQPFGDHSPRHMIIAQAEGNVDTHMQMLGRVHRTGQVVLPRYSQLVANIPAEARPAAVLAKKMASLNASTTASRKSAFTSENSEATPDFLNEYGDQVATQFLLDEPDVGRLIGVNLGTTATAGDVEDVLRKLTGRLTMLPLDEQERILSRIVGDYTDLLAQEDAAGTNKLEAKTLELDARIIDSRTPVESEHPVGHPEYSPFTDGVNMGLYDVKRLSKPFTSEEMLNELARGLGTEARAVTGEELERLGNEARRSTQERYDASEARFEEWRDDYLGKLDEEKRAKNRTKFNEAQEAWRQRAALMRPGAIVRLVDKDGDATSAVVVRVTPAPASSKNPIASGQWKVSVAVPDSRRIMKISFAGMAVGEEEAGKTRLKVERAPWDDTAVEMVRRFDEMAQVSNRERRVIATGNMLTAFTGPAKGGTLVQFRDSEGQIRPGIMMPSRIRSLDAAKRAAMRKLTSAGDVLEVVRTLPPGGMLKSTDGRVILRMKGPRLLLMTPASKKQGGAVFLDKQLGQAINAGLGPAFQKRGENMVAEIAPRNEGPVVQALLEGGRRFEIEAPVRAQLAANPMGWGEAGAVAESERYNDATRAQVSEIIRRVAPASVAGPIFVDAQRMGDMISRLPGAQEAFDRSAGTGTGAVSGERVGGFFSPQTGMLVLSTSVSPFNAANLAHHEAFHALQNAGVTTQAEREIMRREARRLAEYGGRPNLTDQKEIEAYAYGRYASQRDEGLNGGPGLHAMVRNAFARMYEAFRRLGNLARGLGYQTSEDVFERARTGVLAGRAGTGRGTAADPSFAVLGFGKPKVNRSLFTPERVAENIRMNEENGITRPLVEPNKPDFEMPGDNIWTTFKRSQAERFVDLERAQKAIEEARGRPITESMDAFTAQLLYSSKRDARLKDVKREHIEPLAKAMFDAKVNEEDLGTYLIARHAKERNDLAAERDPNNFALDGGSGMATDTARQWMERLEEEHGAGIMESLAARVYAMVELDLEGRYNDGILSDDQYDALKGMFENYVPLTGHGEREAIEGMGGSSRGLDVRGPEYKRTLGRVSLPVNPLHSVIKMVEDGISRGEKNTAGNALGSLVAANKNPEVWETLKSEMDPTGKEVRVKVLNPNSGQVMFVPDNEFRKRPDVLAYKTGGKQRYILLHNQGMAKAYKNLGAPDFKNAIARNLHKAVRVYSSLQTARNPDFMVPNLVRDLQEAGITLASEKEAFVSTMLKNVPLAAAASRRHAFGKPQKGKWAEIVKEWHEAGGQISHLGLSDVEGVGNEFGKLIEDLGPTNVKNFVQRGFKGSVNFLDRSSETFENTTRLAVYAAARERGYSPALAARLSKESTINFNRRGNHSPWMNMAYVFYSASVNGNVKMVEMMARSKKARAIYAGFIPLGLAVAFAMRSGFPDPDDPEKDLYSKIPEWERRRNIIIPTGTERDATGAMKLKYRKIPLAFGLSLPWSIGDTIAELMLGQTTPGKAGVRLVANAFDAFNPVGEGSMATMWAPTLIKPFIEWSANKNFLARPITPEENRNNKGVAHASQPMSRTSNPVFQTLAETVNNATGGTKYTPGIMDAYPQTYEHFIKWGTGGLGRFLADGANGLILGAQGEAPPFGDIPVLRRFVGETRPGATTGRYVEQRDSMDASRNRLQTAKRALERDPTNAAALTTLREEAKVVGVSNIQAGKNIAWKGTIMEAYDKTDKAASVLRDQIQTIQNDTNLSSADRRQKVDEVRARIGSMERNMIRLKRQIDEAAKRRAAEPAK